MSGARAGLVEFLLARIDEDDSVARYAMTRGAPSDADFAGWWLGHYDHANRHSPERVIADCAAKRAVVEMHAAHLTGSRNTLRALAAVYSGHPDYDERWAR